MTRAAAEPAVGARRALEALRAGVPNRDAVVELGSMQIGVEDRFSDIIEAFGVSADQSVEPSAGVTAHSGSTSRAMMIGGGFGSGKSHVLEHLANIGLSQGFVVSKITISKETPLHDSSKVFRAAIDEARLPGRPGSAIDEIAMAIDLDSPEYRDLYRWAHGDDAPVDKQFAATLYLYEYARGDEELRDRIIRFWAGDKLSVTDIRRRLREHGASSSYRIASVREAELSRQRFRFVSRLVRAAGYRGWIVLFDEVELIGRYTIGQRARSYAEIARWVRGDRDDMNAPIGAVLATVDDYETQVLVGKNDIVLVPQRLRASGTAANEVLASLAETGMRIIGREQVKLQPPGQEELDRTYRRLREIHSEAFGWDPPAVSGLERLPSNRMRQYVRAWINEWDLRRLDPSYEPEIEAALVEVDLSQDAGGEDEGAEGEADPATAAESGGSPVDDQASDLGDSTTDTHSPG
ncbi:MAG: BREX system ATP-binding domain-containing protein [Acidimicrobiales bacterium]